ncbi:unnamed protein product, partial [Ascophyllum nodosum]
SLSLALKAFPPEEVVPWWVDELVDEGREQPPPPPSSSGSFSRGGESRRTPQSHLLVFATTCPTKAGPRDFLGVADSRRVSTASGGGGGSGAGLIGLESVWTPSVPASGAHLSQRVPARTQFGQYYRPRTLSAGDLAGLHGDGATEAASKHPTLERLAGALRAHTEKAYASEVLRCLLQRKPV